MLKRMTGINERKRRLKLAENKVNFIRNDANIVNSFTRILMCYLKK